jgi:hypothetical protein
MATDDKGIIDLSYEAAEDLSGHQYKAVVLDAGKVRLPDAATEAALGILENGPAEGEAAAVRRLGISKVHLGGTVAPGDHVTFEYNSASDSGKIATCATTLTQTMGICEEGGAEDELGSALITFPFTINVAS